jgi:dTDP-4-amino-4,6-dideoxygalactose transaminase
MFWSHRQANAAFLNAHIRSVVTPCARPGYDHAWHQYTIRVPAHMDREQAVKRLNEAGIGTGVFYPVPAHKYPYMQALVGEARLDVSERMAQDVISLPVHPLLSQKDLQTIVEAVNSLAETP